jgi:hypothetical protein
VGVIVSGVSASGGGSVRGREGKCEGEWESEEGGE